MEWLCEIFVIALLCKNGYSSFQELREQKSPRSEYGLLFIDNLVFTAVLAGAGAFSKVF